MAEQHNLCEVNCRFYRVHGEDACKLCDNPMNRKYSRKANSNIGHQPDMQAVKNACAALLDALEIDWKNDPNTKETPKRMAKMYVKEVMRGRYEPRPEIKEFPNQNGLDQLYVVGPIRINSMCSHHMVPIVGQAWLGILPNKEGKVLGLSKFARLADWIFRRPQIQEEATIQLADEIEKLTEAQGIAVAVKAQHLCMSWRGVNDPNAMMTTSVTRGLLREKAAARAEFFEMIKGSGF